jgi:Protein kinase domain/PknH-like extracellular domain
MAAQGGRYTSRMPLSAGQTFAGFRVLRPLGSGGMGEVYLVDHPRLPRREALKILSAAATSDSDFRQRFNREAELAATLWHPHIVAVHDRGEFNGQLWITMDYVEGTDAAALIRDRYPAGLPEYFAAEIVSAVADALDYAHEGGMLHRDVKPANILLSDSETAAQRRRILLTDFGIARRMDDNLGLTATNITIGTLAYMAPEQLMGSSLDGRTDQYALAASAFQLLTGKTPLEDYGAALTIGSYLSESPPKLADRRPDLRRFDPVISKGMAKNPAARFPTCRAFATALGEFIPPLTHEHSTLPAAPGSIGEQSPYPAAAPTAWAPVAGTPADKATTAGSGGVRRDSDATVMSGGDRSIEADTKRRGRRRVWIAAALVCAVLLVAGGAVLAVRLTGKPTRGPGASGTPSGLVPASAVGGLLLNADQVHGIVGQQLQEVSASNATTDSSGSFNLPECSGAIYPLESRVYVPTRYTAVRGSLLQPSSTGNPFYPLVEQSVALLPSADRAAQFRADSAQLWQNCAGKPLTVSSGNTTMQTTLANVVSQGDMISQNRTVADGASCQHAMAVWSNVVAEAVVCADTVVDDESQQVAEAILANARHH